MGREREGEKGFSFNLKTFSMIYFCLCTFTTMYLCWPLSHLPTFFFSEDICK